MQAITLNDTQRLFVIPCGGGFSCLGFDVAFKYLQHYAQKLRLLPPDPADIGTLKQYDQYCEAQHAFIATNPQETCFEPGTPVAVQAYLETYRKSNARIRIFTGDTETGRDWMNENDVIGRIGRSMGPLKVPLLCTDNSGGGLALLTSCIVRMMDVATKQEIYRVPNYQLPAFKIVDGTKEGYSHEVLVNDAVHARFKSLDKARHWIAFMRGENMSSRNGCYSER